MMTDQQREICMVLLHCFKIDGQHADEVATEGQVEIFFNLVFRPHMRLQILCSTQYGKSLFVALACIIIACVQHEMVAVVAPTDDKAKIIMRYFIEHLGDHKLFYSELEKDSKLDRLRMEEKKERITMKSGGGIFMISVQAGNSKKGVESAMGAGARIVIEDESGLIPDPIESTVFRMIAGKGEEGFYCKIGNPFYRNHFLTSWKNPIYHRIFIDYKRAISEGRYNEGFIREARSKPMFDILYACKFPGEGKIDQQGYLQLIPESKVQLRERIEGVETNWIGRVILGVDPSGEGKDEATIIARDAFKAECIYTAQTSNAREIAEVLINTVDIFKEKGIEIDPEDIVCDSFGIGADVGKEVALATQGKMEIYTVLLGNHPKDEEEYNGKFFRRQPEELGLDDEDLYLNLRVTMYFRTRKWVFDGGQVVDDVIHEEHGDKSVDNSVFKSELCVIKYKRSLQGNKIQLMSKKDMLAIGIQSPNKADGLALTFLRNIDESKQTKAEAAAIRAEDDAMDDEHSIF